MAPGLFHGQMVPIRVARHGKAQVRPVIVVTPNEAWTEGVSLAGVAIPGTPDPPTGFDVPRPLASARPLADGSRQVALDAADAIKVMGYDPPESMRKTEQAIQRYKGDRNP